MLLGGCSWEGESLSKMSMVEVSAKLRCHFQTSFRPTLSIFPVQESSSLRVDGALLSTAMVLELRFYVCEMSSTSLAKALYTLPIWFPARASPPYSRLALPFPYTLVSQITSFSGPSPFCAS